MMGFKFMGLGRGEKGYTIIELLIVAAIIGILLAIAIPNLIKARISANEANARKAMQTLRDAEAEFFEQDIDNNGTRDFTDLIGDNPPALDNSLRCPDDAVAGGCLEQDALVDSSFTGALAAADGAVAATADCSAGGAGGGDPKAGYCVSWTGDNTDADIAAADYGSSLLQADFGWEASMTSSQKSGRKDYGVWGDGVIRCTATTQVGGVPGIFEATRDGTGGTAAGACD